MAVNPTEWLSSSMSACCKNSLGDTLNQCMGILAEGTEKWYVDYLALTCVKDCEGVSPCGGVAEAWDELFKDKKKCCEVKMPWTRKCLRNEI
ncbi:hypothetical protein QTG54_005641 [Skeletonema marinoi]|uniref:Uncharacterized protein n=1 Tax=Skeletonema marinoi TaxID=267567 RepID=A0AAD9DFA8_9STRA|nr:hypothetical protein QTG54_005641 [Skeletonema marinoi]